MKRINVSEDAALRIIRDAVTDARNGEPCDYLIRDAMTRFRRASKAAAPRSKRKGK